MKTFKQFVEELAESVPANSSGATNSQTGDLNVNRVDPPLGRLSMMSRHIMQLIKSFKMAKRPDTYGHPEASKKGGDSSVNVPGLP
jgi:hypothetical protein